MSKIKIIIPMAGRGTRLAALTRYKPKALVRLADKRLLDHVLDSFRELEQAYSLEYVFIIGYRGEQIRQHMQAAHPNKKVTYFVQEELRGQSHAILLAQQAISGPILITYCDTINEIDFSFLPSQPFEGMASVHEVDDPRRHGIALIGPDNLVTQLVEKPKTREQKFALTGVYYLPEGKDLIKAIETQMETGISLNNEYYLADALNILLKSGLRLRPERARQWLDAGTPEAMLETNACLLQSRPESYAENLGGQPNLLTGPVYIHRSSRVQNCIIGPYVSIGENCTLSGSILRNTIVDDDSSVTNATLEDSLIGRGGTLSGKAAQAILADHGEMRIYYSADETTQTRESSSS